MSVAKKLTSGKEAQAELSIRFWDSNKSFLVTTCSSYREAWVTEHCLIGMWQPRLNHPYIMSFLKRSALGFRPNKRVRLSAFSRFGMRLWRKLRKKLFHTPQEEIHLVQGVAQPKHFGLGQHSADFVLQLNVDLEQPQVAQQQPHSKAQPVHLVACCGQVMAPKHGQLQIPCFIEVLECFDHFDRLKLAIRRDLK